MKNRIELDDVDKTIIDALKKDGRKSFTDLAQEMNASVGMIRNRYNRLVDHKIIQIIGWTDPVKVGLHAYARVLIKVRPSDKIQSVAEQIMRMDEVSFVAVTTGNSDIEINVACKDNADLLDVLNSKIHVIDGVFESSTTMYLDVLKWSSHDIDR